MNVCIVQPNKLTPSETFVRAHAEKLPASVNVLYGLRPRSASRATTLIDRLQRTKIRAARRLCGQSIQWEITELLLSEFQKTRPAVVLAQYGPTGVRVMDACRRLSIPLIVCFRGFDANNHDTVAKYRDGYSRLFDQAAAIMAVSQPIRSKLIALGARPQQVHFNPSGADCERFHGADPANAPPMFLTVGRFVENKAPHLTIMAFAETQRHCPDARLHMIGDGPDLNFCRELARRLGVDGAIRFLGAQPHDVVRDQMRAARAVVHPSIVAATGDAEGTPVVVMEAGACGLPVVASRIGGIPDVVLHERTGLLVEQRDIFGMARQMQRLANNPQLASQLGAAAQQHIRRHFSQAESIRRLWTILQIVAPTAFRHDMPVHMAA